MERKSLGTDRRAGTDPAGVGWAGESVAVGAAVGEGSVAVVPWESKDVSA